MKKIALLGLVAMAMLSGCGPSTDDIRNRAISAFQVGRMAEAQENFDKVLASRPADSMSLFYLGRIRHAQGDTGMAIYFYQCAIDSDPTNQEARRWLARAKEEMGPTGESLQFLPRKG